MFSSLLLSSLISSAAAQAPGIGACCYSATCLADKHCAPGCGTAALPCSDYTCKNCECCPCCSGTTDSCAATAPNTPPFQPASAECCKTGYSGPGCADPACDESCGSHGKCSAPNVCTCDAGWGGTLCNEAVCNGKTVGGCGPNGNCTAPNTCECVAGHRNSAYVYLDRPAAPHLQRTLCPRTLCPRTLCPRTLCPRTLRQWTRTRRPRCRALLPPSPPHMLTDSLPPRRSRLLSPSVFHRPPCECSDGRLQLRRRVGRADVHGCGVQR